MDNPEPTLGFTDEYKNQVRRFFGYVLRYFLFAIAYVCTAYALTLIAPKMLANMTSYGLLALLFFPTSMTYCLALCQRKGKIPLYYVRPNVYSQTRSGITGYLMRKQEPTAFKIWMLALFAINTAFFYFILKHYETILAPLSIGPLQ